VGWNQKTGKDRKGIRASPGIVLVLYNPTGRMFHLSYFPARILGGNWVKLKLQPQICTKKRKKTKWERGVEGDNLVLAGTWQEKISRIK
jgi:hypothetical protein